MTANEVKQALAGYADPQRVHVNQWFFKTSAGQYGHGDQFIGVKVPQQRLVAEQNRELPLSELGKLFASPVHEHRLTACFICVYKYQTAKRNKTETEIYDFYLMKLRAGRVNNWDMVDTSVPQIIGDYLLNWPRGLLYELASGDLWQKRASIMATLAFIKEQDYGDTFKLAEMLLEHPHDLIQKAVGWMLREVGNRDMAAEEEFLKTRYQRMPRTMLRYSIEKFPKTKRQAYLAGYI